MKRILCLFFSFLISMISVHAENYILMSDDERILVSNREHEIRSIASTTKLMTALVCLESGDYLDVWHVGEEIRDAEEKRIYLVEGQRVSMHSLLHGLLLESGNDAALVLAKHVGGSVENFVSLMNKKAEEIGMKNTLFRNPHGLDVHEKGNESTCFDMALLMNYALGNKQLCEILQTLEYHSEWGSIFHNSNRLLDMFPFCLGGKTGYTSKAGRTLVTAAENQGLRLVCVTFQIHDHFQFHQQLYTEAMNQYEKFILMKEGSYRMIEGVVEIDEPFSVTCTMDELSCAEVRHVIDKDSVTFQFVLDDYVVYKTYSIKKKNRLWGLFNE